MRCPARQLVLALLVVSCDACSKRVPPVPDARPAVRAGGLSVGDPELAQAMREVVERCHVSSTGRVTRCPEDENRHLRRMERSLGARSALGTYCHGLADSDPRLRALSASGLSRLAYRQAVVQAGDHDLLGCLLDRLRHHPDRAVARPLARAATFLACSLGRERELVPLLDRSTIEIREAGYRALWEAGRPGALASLTRLLQDRKAPLSVRIAAIEGLQHGDALSPDERPKVCGLLEPLLAAPELELAAAAARISAHGCPGLASRVLETAEARLEKGQMPPALVSAVRETDDASDERRARVVSLLSRIVEDRRFNDDVRAVALRKLSWIGQARARRLARKPPADAGEALRRAVEQLVGE